MMTILHAAFDRHDRATPQALDQGSLVLNDLDRIFLAANVLNKDFKFYRKDKERIPDRSLVCSSGAFLALVC